MLVGLFIISIRPKYGELRGVVKEGYCVLHSLTDLFYRWTVTRESSPVHRGLHRINSEDTLAGTSVCTDPSQHPDQYIPSQKLPDSATILRLLAYMQSHIKNSFLRVLISQFKESTIFSILCFKRNIDFFSIKSHVPYYLSFSCFCNFLAMKLLRALISKGCAAICLGVSPGQINDKVFWVKVKKHIFQIIWRTFTRQKDPLTIFSNQK